MLIKWVRCEVTDPAAFDRGQRGWGALAGLPGFLGQRGGWGEQGIAHVVAFWRSADDHAAFLAGPHDALAAAQRGTYGEIEVRLFEGDPALVASDLRCVTGEVVALEPSWTVPPAV
ncbi:protein of unknown function [Lentzea waywayandensis]|uniref:DUF4937 domain-containing protein n=1 Tax=Lentzea waywayandensis TaxID=84724 RepID=A0A1I6FFU6_9PSEU|nr:DUF4937 domain-containing protein [Lentzea waywayandensis]SFR28762.1 protein of unknown function [Lentzea waywayandensis]